MRAAFSILVLVAGLSACAPARQAVPVRPQAAAAPLCVRPLQAPEGPARLAELRTQIDCVDATLARLVGERLAIARDVGATKRRQGLAVVDTTREAAVTARFVALAGAQGVPPETAATLIQTLILAARAQQ